MARPVKRLSAIEVSKLSKPGYHADGAGLYLQVSPSLSKSWIFRYRFDGRQKEMGLGAISALTLAQAREAAAACRTGLAAKVRVDPIQARLEARREADALRAKQRTIPTFDECAVAYVNAHRPEWKSTKHAQQWATTLQAYASPHFGRMKVSEIGKDEILSALNPIWLTKMETASRLRGRVEKILDYAIANNYRSAPNPATWAKNLALDLASPEKAQKVVHFAALPWREIGDFMVDLRKRDGVAARAVEFAILTAARSGEVRLATWAEIDLQSRTWTIPGSRMKAGIQHQVPLSDAAMQLLRQMPRIEGCDWIFPGAKSKALSDMSLSAVLRRMGRSETVHGYRSSFRDWAAESAASSFGRQAAEHALAHKLPDKVEAAYQRSDLFEKRIGLMQAWSDYCATTSATTATVTPIRSAA